MNNRQRVHAIMNYENYDRMPVVHFGLWDETLEKWVREGHISGDEAKGRNGGNPPPEAMKDSALTSAGAVVSVEIPGLIRRLRRK